MSVTTIGLAVALAFGAGIFKFIGLSWLSAVTIQDLLILGSSVVPLFIAPLIMAIFIGTAVTSLLVRKTSARDARPSDISAEPGQDEVRSYPIGKFQLLCSLALLIVVGLYVLLVTILDYFFDTLMIHNVFLSNVVAYVGTILLGVMYSLFLKARYGTNRTL